MTVDLEAIARRSGCDLASLKLALPLIEQGLAPPFLARYRRDELGGISEPALWMLQRAVRSERQLANRREELTKQWQRTRLQDRSIQRAIRDARSRAAINRVARRLKSEAVDPQTAIAPETWIASRLLTPEPGDGVDIEQIVAAAGQSEHREQINANLDRALARRLAEHPQILSAAVRWLSTNASIKFLEVSDPNVDPKGDEEVETDASASSDRPGSDPGANWPSPEQLASGVDSASADSASAVAGEATTNETTAPESATAEPPTADTENVIAADVSTPAPATDEALAATAESPVASDVAATTDVPAAPVSGAENTAASSVTAALAPETAGQSAGAAGKGGGKKKEKAAKPIVKKTKVFKKLSPRQRRRRWLISILEPLVGKQVPIRELSPFQTLVLSRALRGNLVKCQFVYDANQLIGQLQKVASGLNQPLGDRLAAVVATEEAAIRDTTESAWWDELQEIATLRLVDITAEHLDRQLHRGPLDVKTVLAIDAVGPRTSPVAVVTADGRVLHSEDISCQLENELRTASVTRLGELIHRFGVDLIVIGNGPARRASLVILGELISQSPEGSVSWTLAERSGADIYAGSELADREMRTTPRRFRAATWLAFTVLNPAWALAKVSPLRLRLSSIQRELPDEPLVTALNDVMASAVSRGGLDVNTAAIDSLAQLPGMNRTIATAIDRRRRERLFTSRADLLSLPEWGDGVSSRQAIGFLRVFGSDEPLDATVIHPDDYALARKLAGALSLQIPPAAPPRYQPPKFDAAGDVSANGPVISDQTPPVPTPEAESFEASKESPDFAAELLAGDETASGETASGETANGEAVEPAAVENADVVAETAQTDAAEPQDAVADPVAEAVDEAPATEVAETVEASDTPAGDDTEVTATEEEAVFAQSLPDPAAINKCIREWQVGSCRAHHLVHALCQPFGEEKLGDLTDPPAVMNRLPRSSDLRVGDAVVGVVASVTPFGAFVEITPEATGLIRVSRLAEEFVEEIHDYLQVGDVVTAWVAEVDKRRKLQLSAISPQREEALRQRRQEARDQRRSRGAGPRRGGGREARETVGAGAQGQGGQARGGEGAGGQGHGGHSAGGQRDGGRGPRGGQERRDGREPRRGGGRDDRRDGRGRDRGHRDEPISYTTRVPKNPVPLEPLSDAMAEGKEPMRSFGDLLQFFQKDQPQPPAPTTSKKAKPVAASESPTPSAETPPSVDRIAPASEPASSNSPSAPGDSGSGDSTTSDPSA